MIDKHAPGNMQFVQLSEIAIRNIPYPGSLWQERCEILFFSGDRTGQSLDYMREKSRPTK